MKRSSTEKAATKEAAKAPAKAGKKRNVKAKGTTSARKVAATKAFAHWAKGSSPYHGVTGPVRGLLIVAAFIVSGYARLNKETIGKAPKGSKELFVGLVGRTPYNYHKREHRIGDAGFTAEGLKWFQHRIADKEDRALVGKLVTAMQKGGKVEGLNFNRAIAS